MPRPTQDTFKRSMHFAYGGITLFAQASQLVLLYIDFVTLKNVLQPQPKLVWALPRSLAATDGIIIYFLFLLLLRCFNSQRIALPHLCIQCGVTRD